MFEKPLKMYGLLLVIAVMVFAGFFVKKEEVLYEKYHMETQSYNEGWEVSRLASNYITLTNTLPDDLLIGTGLSFITKFQFVLVKLNGDVIYQFDILNEGKRNAVGNMWHFIDIPIQYSGKTIEITLLSIDKNSSRLIPKFQIGNKDNLVRDVIKKGIVSLTICVSFGLFGIIICLLWLFQREKLRLDERFLCLGTICFYLSVWVVMDSQVIQVLWGNYYVMTSLTSLIMLLILFPVIRFIRLSFRLENFRFIDIITYIYLGIACLTSVGNLLNLINIKDMYRIAGGCMAACIVFILFFLGGQCIKAKGKERNHLLKHLFCFFLIAGIMAVDVTRYFKNQSVSYIQYTKIIAFAYLFILSLNCFKESTKLIKSAKETEKMNAIAYQDALTCLGNRAAFLERMNKIKPESYSRYGIAMFDLNNLKIFNDIYGHSAGDYYIIISSEIIQDIFGQKGKIYRMGGDEFCAILKDCEKDEFERNALQMQERLEQLKGPYANGEMEIASGYEKFNPEIDIDLTATSNRADALMYKNKLEMKKQGQQ